MAKWGGGALSLSRRQAIVATAALAGAFVWGGGRALAAVQAKAYPLDSFFEWPGTRGAALSPDGQRIAVLQQYGSQEEPQAIIKLLDAAQPDGEGRHLNLGNLGVSSIQWANDRRLLVGVVIKGRSSTRQVTGSIRKREVTGYDSRRIVSVDVATGEMAIMFADERERIRYSPYLDTITDILRHDPDHILMVAVESDGALALHKVNVNTGVAERIERGSTSTIAWVTHDGVPVLRRDINTRGSVETWHARMPGEAEWRFMRRTRVYDAPDFRYIGQGTVPERIRVAIRVEGEDFETIRDMDLKDFNVGPSILPMEGADAIGGLYDRSGVWLGASYYKERLEYLFEDADLAAHHRALNRFFDDDCDIAFSQVSLDRNRLIAYARGPREAGTWVLYDRQTHKATPLGMRSQLDFESLGRCERVEVKTRDGSRIEAYLTAPPGQAAGPLVVLPHGGPEVRDYRTYDRQVQVQAAQGWWVLQPNFRGSGGYGKAFAEAGWRRWADRMQEDIEDAIDHVIAAKGLDRSRVAIMGASYGGYAALMGAVRRPELYKAAIAICGVSDVVEMLQWEKRTDDTPGNMIFDFWTKRIGNLDTDRAMLETASPRLRATEIRCPVMLVHGKDDQIVPVNQSRIMERALKAAGARVSLREIERAGHADWNDETEKDLMGSYVALLKEVFA